MGKSAIFHGKIHYFDWAMFNSELCLPEGMWVKQYHKLLGLFGAFKDVLLSIIYMGRIIPTDFHIFQMG